MADQAPLPLLTAWPSVGRCVLTSVRLLAAGRVHQPRTHVGRWLRFADGSAARVYRETVIDRPSPSEPAVLVVAFRLRAVRGRGHDLFRRESLLNTPLFVGFPRLRLQALDGQRRTRGLSRALPVGRSSASRVLRPRPVAGPGPGQRSGLNPLPRTAGAAARRRATRPAANAR
jgi:hypothetical protein